MKKLLLSLALVIVASTSLSAKVGIGVLGGANFTVTQWDNIFKGNFDTIKNTTSWYAGLGIQVPLSKAWTLGTGAIFTNKSASMLNTSTQQEAGMKLSYVEVPLTVQLGIDLAIFRPYIEAGAFGGYMVDDTRWGIPDGYTLNKWEGGLKAGLGFQLWIFELSAHYNWNLVPIYKENDTSFMSTVSVSLGIIF